MASSVASALDHSVHVVQISHKLKRNEGKVLQKKREDARAHLDEKLLINQHPSLEKAGLEQSGLTSRSRANASRTANKAATAAYLFSATPRK